MSAESMSLRAAFGPHLPYLRRYARAVAGSQQSGDRFVRAALEALLTDHAATELDLSLPRRTLFRLFHAFWTPDHGRDAGDVDMIPSGREALLLTAVEGFSVADAGYILDQSADDVAQALESARAAIAAAIRSRVLIIEDEPIISMHLEQIVTDMGHDVVGSAITRDEAVAEARRAQPDLVLADIQLADGSSGVDAVADILGEMDVPVVFITAYPERLLTGDRREPTWLVTKPFEPETVMATVGQALLSRQKLFSVAE